jgi:glycosyltransferase involved in cell wall biosynthesis
MNLTIKEATVRRYRLKTLKQPHEAGMLSHMSMGLFLRLTGRSIALVLPMREEVTSGRAGAVALNVAEFGQRSAFHQRLLVIGGAERGDFTLPYHRIRPQRKSLFGVPWAFWRRASGQYAEAVTDIIAAERCVLAEVHNRARLFNRVSERLGPDIRLCLYLHNDPQTMEGLRTSAERARLLERADMIYCLSNFISGRFIDGVTGPLERVVVLPNGVAPIMPDRPQRHKSILFVGRLIPEKGVEELFHALRRLARQLPDWQAVIIFRAPKRYRQRYQRALADLGSSWADRITLAESVPHAAVMQAFAHAAITVVPSQWQEPFGRTALEALASGSAVIASRSGGLPEVVGQAGLLLDAIESAILSLAHDPARREAMGKAGEQRVAAHFDIDVLSRRLDARRRDLLAE